jgi:hypothetical protein
MRVDLTTDEAVTLRGVLQDCVLGLKREIARTENHDFRHQLVVREDLCEKLISQLDTDPSRTPAVPPL